jgi:hypothetical protein
VNHEPTGTDMLKVEAGAVGSGVSRTYHCLIGRTRRLKKYGRPKSMPVNLDALGKAPRRAVLGTLSLIGTVLIYYDIRGVLTPLLKSIGSMPI